MSKEINYNEYAAKALQSLSKGAFLTTSHGGQANTMTIGWGAISHMWGKPVFIVMVRGSRYTYGLLEASGEFTVSIPLKDMQKAVNICGSQSGRNVDKFAAAAIVPQAAKTVAAPVVAGCGLYYECKVVYKQAMQPAELTAELQQKWYANNDYHTLYFGEILSAYIDE